MFAAVTGLEPATSAILRRFANLASRHTMYIYSSTQATVSHNRFNISRPHYWTCLSDIDVSFSMLRCYRNHSAFNSHNLPSDLRYYLPALLLRVGANSWPLQGSELTSFLLVVLTGWVPSLSTPSALRSISLPFQLRALHDPLRDYSPPILPLCIQYIQPTCRDCTLHVPRRLWKVKDSNQH